MRLADGMIVPGLKFGVAVALLVEAAGVMSGNAELPTLSDKEWSGYFVGIEDRKFRFGITSDGKSEIRVIGKTGKPVGGNLSVDIDFRIEETMPDGKVVVRQIKPESLESAQPATKSPKDIVISGKVTGDTAFEIHVSEEKGAISLGGRLLVAGNLKNPTRFTIGVRFPNVYVTATKTGDRREVRTLEDKIKGDRLELLYTDKKKVRLSTSDQVDAGSKEINGPGISELELELAAYNEDKFEIVASPNSSMTLFNDRALPLNEGFTVIWAPDPAKDSDGKARINIEVR
jgi:hypothetical protein